MSGLSELMRRLIVVTRSRRECGVALAVHCNGETWDTGPDTGMIDAAVATLRDARAHYESYLLPISSAALGDRADVAADSPGGVWQHIAVGVAPAWRLAKVTSRGKFLRSTRRRTGILPLGMIGSGDGEMSKLMRDLADAEQRRKSEENRLLAERDGEAAALTWLAEEARGTAKATEVQEVQREAQEVARRRADAEAAAVEQARARLKAEIASRALTLERISLEREAERLAQQRQEAEEQALAEARRREQAATDLRAAIAARLKRETQAKEVAEARAASEQAALQAANDRIQMERSLEATAMSRRAAERDGALLAEQRKLREVEAARAEAARREVESQLRPATDDLDNFEQTTVMVGLLATDTTDVAEEPSLPPSPLSRGIVAVAGLVVGIALGWLSAEQFGAPPVPKPPSPPIPTLTPPPQGLRIDTDAEAFGHRAESRPLPSPDPATGAIQGQQ